MLSLFMGLCVHLVSLSGVCAFHYLVPIYWLAFSGCVVGSLILVLSLCQLFIVPDLIQPILDYFHTHLGLTCTGLETHIF